MKVLGLPPSNKEECIDFCDAIPAGEMAECWISVWKCQKQKGDEMMAQNQPL